MRKLIIIICLLTYNSYAQIGVISSLQKLRQTNAVIEEPQPSVSVPIVIILGQSNADGGAFVADFSTDINTFYSTDHPNLKIYYKPAIRNHDNGNIGIMPSSLVDDGEWWTLTNGHDAVNKKTSNTIGMPNSTVAIGSSQIHGPEAAMGKWWEENRTGQELRIIKFGIGSTGLQDNWLPIGGLYDIFMQYVYNPAIADIIAEGNTPELIGVYWNQGENDTNPTMSVNYEANLNALIYKFRTDTGFTNARWVIGQLSDYTNTVDFNIVKNAQAAVAASDNNVELIITDGTGDLPMIETNPTDDIHYSSNGQTQLANAFWDIIFPVPVVSNFVAETNYFDAVLVPVSEKANLQWYLDTYNHVRLENAEYGFNTTPQVITIGSNQSIYGHPLVTILPTINILAGSTNVHLENVYPYNLNFLAGAPITNSVFNNIKWASVKSTGGMIEDNLFLNLRANIDFDFTSGGYYRNNVIIRHQGGSNLLKLKGNSTTPGYGNLHSWTNSLTPNGGAVILDNMGDISFLGFDCEGWNSKNEAPNGFMFTATNMGRMSFASAGGGSSYNPVKIPAFSFQAEDMYLLDFGIDNQGSTRLSEANGNMFSVKIFDNNIYTVTNGYDFKAHPAASPTLDGKSMYYNGTLTNTLITDQTIINNLKENILGTVHTPIAKPTFETIPDPLGVNWATDRIGKPDSTTYIQNLIDTNDIAELPEGVFYISSTLRVNSVASGSQGIIGQGTGKTVICGLTDDFPLVTIYNSDATVPIVVNNQGNITLANITFQGGLTGLHAPTDNRNLAFNVWKHVVFRDQQYGIHFEEIFGFDNNYLENICFVNCGIGFFNDHRASDGSQEFKDYFLGYVDKTVFYKCQFINCGIGAIVKSDRACNLNHFTECNFDRNGLVANISGNNDSAFINCVMKNNTGGGKSGELIIAGGIGLFNCDFSNNSGNYTFDAQEVVLEGCNFLDNATMFSPTTHREERIYILNSTVNGALGGGSINADYGVFINNTFTQVPALNKLLVNMKAGVKTTIIDEPSNPYPQFFVKH